MGVLAILGVVGAGAVIIIGILFIVSMAVGGAVYGTVIVQGVRQLRHDPAPCDDPPPFGW